MSWVFAALNIVGFVLAADLANNARNWPTQLLWVFAALMSFAGFLVNATGALS